MRKIIFWLFALVFIIFASIDIFAETSQASNIQTQCKNGFEYKKVEYRGGSFTGCYNSNIHLMYNSYFDFYLETKKDDKKCISNERDRDCYNVSPCGYACDFEGKNCKSGVCNLEECDIKGGFTQIKLGKCYNPVTGSYQPELDKLTTYENKQNTKKSNSVIHKIHNFGCLMTVGTLKGCGVRY